MFGKRAALFGAACVIAFVNSKCAFAAPGDSAPTAGPQAVEEIIVTAQKRSENIQNVGMSIQSATGDELIKLGITDTSLLQKIVPGFLSTPEFYGTTVYTIRGVGFQDTSLAGSPTVSVYLDEAPLPYSILAEGATLDLQRVEVLKGPQGTLFGENATGGAINYIANKPTDTYEGGLDVSYGSFSDTSLQGYISGPVADGLDLRLALQSHTSGPWQKGYGPATGPSSAGQTTGGTDLLNGRLSALWKPNDRFKALLTMSGWQDRSYDQVGQLYGTGPENAANFDPNIAAYPLAPHNDQAAAWLSCVNDSPFDPVAGQAYGTQFYTPYFPNGSPSPAGQQSGPTPPGYTGANAESAGAGSVIQAGGQPTHCVPLRRNNIFYDFDLRVDYDLPNDMQVTSITEYQRFTRFQPLDGSGVPYQDNQNIATGSIASVFQELRLSGNWWSEGNWIVGANYEHDKTGDSVFGSSGAFSDNPTILPFAEFCFVFGGCTPQEIPGSPSYNPAKYPLELVDIIGPTRIVDAQVTSTYAAYASGEYPILDNLSALGGVRFTQSDKVGRVCALDGGDGTASALGAQISNLLELLNGGINLSQYLNGGGHGVDLGPGSCITTGPGPYYLSSGANYPGGVLDQNNVSWKAGLNWKVTPQDLLYVSVSKGYKSGSFPTLALSTASQAAPAVQESLLAYEVGTKSTLFDHQLTVNAAAFYYDYTNKQITGAVPDPVFGTLPELINVPQSHVAGFEVSGPWSPHWLSGLVMTPAVSYQESRIDKSPKNSCSQSALTTDGNGSTCVPGDFYNYDVFGNYANFTGERFPSTPLWQASIDAEYDWEVADETTAFAGLNANYSSGTNSDFVNRSPPAGKFYDPEFVRGYALLDMRAGIERDAWRFQFWGRNITNTYYWTIAQHRNDVLLRYTGMPATFGVALSYRY